MECPFNNDNFWTEPFLRRSEDFVIISLNLPADPVGPEAASGEWHGPDPDKVLLYCAHALSPALLCSVSVVTLVNSSAVVCQPFPNHVSGKKQHHLTI